MKLRIKGDSLRIRVTQGELREFAVRGSVEDQIRFGPERALVYRLSRGEQVPQLSARFEQGVIEVAVPDADARRWCESNEVTLAATQSGQGMDLRITIEKDFACLVAREGEDESDNFPHPEGGTGAKC